MLAGRAVPAGPAGPGLSGQSGPGRPASPARLAEQGRPSWAGRASPGPVGAGLCGPTVWDLLVNVCQHDLYFTAGFAKYILDVVFVWCLRVIN